MTQTSDKIHFSITSSFENVADLAEKVSALCGARPGCDDDTVDTMRLCLAEALNNIVEHAYGGADGRPIYADVLFEDGRYEVQLMDEGQAMPGGDAPEGEGPSFDTADFENLPEGGFGWMLIRSQMDKVEYERREGCNVLRLEKQIAA